MKLNLSEEILVVVIGYRYVKNKTCKVTKIKVWINKSHDMTSRVDDQPLKFKQSMKTEKQKSAAPDWEELFDNQICNQKYPLSTQFEFCNDQEDYQR